MPVTRRKATSAAIPAAPQSSSLNGVDQREIAPNPSPPAASTAATRALSRASSESIVAAGACVNVLLIGVKFGASLRSGSAALLAEANHSLFDLAADAGAPLTQISSSCFSFTSGFSFKYLLLRASKKG